MVLFVSLSFQYDSDLFLFRAENGAEEEKRPSTQTPLRPSAFRPGGGILAPSRLGVNPFVSRPSAVNQVVQDGSCFPSFSYELVKLNRYVIVIFRSVELMLCNYFLQ